MGNIFTKPLFGTKPREPLTDPVEIQRARLTVQDNAIPLVSAAWGIPAGFFFGLAVFGIDEAWPAIRAGGLARSAIVDLAWALSTTIGLVLGFWFGVPLLARIGLRYSRRFKSRKTKFYRSHIKFTHHVSMRMSVGYVVIFIGLGVLVEVLDPTDFSSPIPPMLFTASGTGLLALGLRSRRGMDPRCRNCGYPNALPPDPSTCTECGRDLTTHDGLMLGLPVRDPRMIVPGAVMLVAGCVWIALT